MSRRLTLREYEQSKTIASKGYDFYGIIAAAMRQAGTLNLDLLRAAWPGIYESFVKRYNSPLGVVEEWDGWTAEEYYGTLRAQRSEAEESDA